MNTYSTPTIFKETLSNGGKIPIIIYEMNPMRDPNKRINHYRNVFQNESQIFNKTQSFFRKQDKRKNNRKKKKDPKSAYKLYNSIYQKLFLRINYDRPTEIKNPNGVIISRHFKTLDINSREYPPQRIMSYYFTNKANSQKKLGINKGNYHFGGGSFFSTEIKYPFNNKNNKIINYDSNKMKKYDYLSSNLNNNTFSKTFYNSNSGDNKFANIENYNINNINQKKYFDKKTYQVMPLLFKNNYNNSNKTNLFLN